MKTARGHAPSFIYGFLAASVIFATVHFESRAEAIDFKNISDFGRAITTTVKSLTGLKKNLDSDVSALTGHAKILVADKENLAQIKEQLLKLATETRTQIDSVQTLVSTVDGHIKETKKSIDTTAMHVNEIETIKKALQTK